jgi:hypothetical protein
MVPRAGAGDGVDSGTEPTLPLGPTQPNATCALYLLSMYADRGVWPWDTAGGDTRGEREGRNVRNTCDGDGMMPCTRPVTDVRYAVAARVLLAHL